MEEINYIQFEYVILCQINLKVSLEKTPCNLIKLWKIYLKQFDIHNIIYSKYNLFKYLHNTTYLRK